MISVVLSAFDAREQLPATLDSVLSQQGCDFEVLVVDDGSSDGTAELLGEWARREPRLRVLSQVNQGLTRALMRACAEARGNYIARQDVGDVSLPGRLRAQRDLLDNQPQLAFVGCHHELVGPADEPLVSPLPEPPAPGSGVRNRDGSLLPTPHHGTAMFRKSAYLAAGGYRPQFYFAQDMDLWLRMIEQGDLGYVPQVLYRVKFDLDSITARHRPAQQALRAVALQAAAARAAGHSEAPQLDAAARIRPQGARRLPVGRRAAAAYFVASCLLARRDPRAQSYLLQAVRSNPLHVKAWLRLASLRVVPGAMP